MSETTPPVILVPGWIHDQALARLSERFRIERVAGSDVALLTEAGRRARGIATAAAVDAALIDALPQLEIIAGFGVGYDAIDARHAATRGVMVTNTPDVLTEEVADTALGLLINTVRELPRAEAYLRAGKWLEKPYPLTRSTLRGRTVGIFGLGRIGLAIARRVEAFGLPVAYHNRRPAPDVGYAYHHTLLDLARTVDTLIAVAPGGAATRNAVNAEVLAALGPDGVLVNVGRGSTVDEPALIEALANGTIRAAGLDVFADEPRVPQALVDLPNASLLPHVASASVHTRRAMADLVADNLIAWFDAGRAVTPVAETATVRRG